MAGCLRLTLKNRDGTRQTVAGATRVADLAGRAREREGPGGQGHGRSRLRGSSAPLTRKGLRRVPVLGPPGCPTGATQGAGTTRGGRSRGGRLAMPEGARWAALSPAPRRMAKHGRFPTAHCRSWKRSSRRPGRSTSALRPQASFAPFVFHRGGKPIRSADGPVLPAIAGCAGFLWSIDPNLTQDFPSWGGRAVAATSALRARRIGPLRRAPRGRGDREDRQQPGGAREATGAG